MTYKMARATLEKDVEVKAYIRKLEITQSRYEPGVAEITLSMFMTDDITEKMNGLFTGGESPMNVWLCFRSDRPGTPPTAAVIDKASKQALVTFMGGFRRRVTPKKEEERK